MGHVLSHRFLVTSTMAVSVLAMGAVSGFTVASAQAAPAKKTIAVIVPTLKITVLQIESKAAIDEAHKLGYNTVMLTHDFNTATELHDAQQLITERVAGVAWNVANENASSVAVKEVRKAGIPVVNMDRVLTDHKVADASYESNNYQCGALSATAFVKLVGDHGNYAELTGPKSDPMARVRSDGYHSVLDKTNLKMVAQQSAPYDETKGFQLAGTILQAHPHIVGFVTGNDSIGLGAAAAIKAQHKKGMVVTGIDGGKDAIAAVNSGASPFKATAAQPVAIEGKDAVIALNEIIRGMPGALTNGKVTEVPCTLVMKK